VLKKAKFDREEKARVKDVLEGWGHGAGSTGVAVGGQEFERGLRKVAQRGVIKLFNAILSASKTAEAQATSHSLSLADQVGVRDKDPKAGKKERDNVLGRGGKGGLTKEGFLDMVRRG